MDNRRHLAGEDEDRLGVPHGVLLGEGGFKPHAKDFRVEHVGDADSRAGDAVSVGGPDSPSGGSNASRSAPNFGHGVEMPVVGENHMGPGIDAEALLHGDSALGEPFNLLDDGFQVHNHPGQTGVSHAVL